jgi:hypothetical protein
MKLELKLSVGVDFEATDVYLTRALGEPVRWRFHIRLPQGHAEPEHKELEAGLRRALCDGPCRAIACLDGTPLGPEATIVGASRPWAEHWAADQTAGRDPSSLEIQACSTKSEPQPDPFAPRRRVHRVRNAKELIRRFDHVARPVSNLLAELESVTFPDGEHASIVQDDISDWDFLHDVLEQCERLGGPDKPWLPLTLMGGSDREKGSEGLWQILPGQRRAWVGWGAVRGRTITFDEAQDGIARVEFGALTAGARVPAFPADGLPAVAERRSQRSFDAGRWRNWRSMDLPRFTENGAMVHRIEDRLYLSAGALVLDSWTWALPPEARIPTRERPGRPRPWIGLGRVTETSKTAPWIRVELPGFEDDAKEIEVRVGTPFSGKNGRRGQHMVPENGTEVVVAWTGRFDQSIVLMGNARSEDAEFPSPSTWLEDEYKTQYANVHVVEIGRTSVDSSFDMWVKQQTDIASGRPLRVKADGADLDMQGGIVYTGRSG